METTTSPAQVAGYGAYQRNANEGGGDITRKDGSAVEYVELRDPDTTIDEGIRRFTLDRSINGDRPPVGATVTAKIKDWIEPEAAIGRTGRPYMARKRKNLVIGFSPVK